MSFWVRNGSFDVTVIPGPRLPFWPSVGSKVLTKLCAEYGLSVGMLGVEGINAVGVMSQGTTGAIVFAEDSQKRIHRLKTRAVIRFSSPPEFPAPFDGWASEGLFPYSTFYRLKKSASLSWNNGVAILGSSNRAFRLGCELLEVHSDLEVHIIESEKNQSEKQVYAWEVEKRRFESLGGRIIFGKCRSLIKKSAAIWELRVEDGQGVRILELCRVVSVGPFSKIPDYRGYPLGSNMIEVFQTSLEQREDDLEGWIREEEVAKLIAGKLVRRLSISTEINRDEIESSYKKSKHKIKKLKAHLDNPWSTTYDGKLLSKDSKFKLLNFTGVPREIMIEKPLASIECHEDISCQICQKSCPEGAIDFSKKLERILIENKCTGCGLCLPVCPSQSISLLQEDQSRQKSFIYKSTKTVQRAKDGEFVQLLNRKGDSLGTGRLTKEPFQILKSIVKVEVPPHLIWDVREFKRTKAKLIEEDQQFVHAHQFESQTSKRVEVSVKGHKRLIKDNISLAQAFFEIGHNQKEEMLFCKDGSCGLCSAEVDGIHKKTCQTNAHQGMTVKNHRSFEMASADTLCPCMNISIDSFKNVVNRLQGSKLESVFETSKVACGKCHGMRCLESARQIMSQLRKENGKFTEESWPIEYWVDWRFPMYDWTLYPQNKNDE